MKRKSCFALIALVLAVSLALCACGKQEQGNSGDNDGSPMTLTDWTLTPETWSSPNGATVHLKASVNHRDDTVTAAFVVRQGDGDVATVDCQWEKDTLTASADLNGADGYSYFVVLTGSDGSLTEVALNADQSLVNLASALESYCNVVVTDSRYEGSTLTLVAGSGEIQAPQITDDGAAIGCEKAELVLLHDGEELTRTAIDPQTTEVAGAYVADLAGTTFTVPTLEDDGQIVLRLEVKLTNGQELSCEGPSWTYLDGQIVSSVG